MAMTAGQRVAAALLLAMVQLHAGEAAVALPASVAAVWAADKAVHETTATRERVCLNGLWLWQPEVGTAHRDGAAARTVPDDSWGYFKVPGSWPGITDYMQHESQTVYRHPAWAQAQLAAVTAAWYQRTITIPASWAQRRIALQLEGLASLAAVFIDGQPVGTLRFPGGELELVPAPAAGEHRLAMRVAAVPLKSVMQSFNDTSSVKEVAGSVARRGLCGDAWLCSAPAAARITALAVHTSVSAGTISIDADLAGLVTEGRYRLHARIADHGQVVKDIMSPAFAAAELKQGRLRLSEAWKPEKLWDIITPGNVYQLSVTLSDAAGALLDEAAALRFGFRELSISGRDLLLNGKRIYLSALPLDNAQISAATATYEAAKETMLRLKGIGINCVYTHNYGCEPGTHLAFDGILAAADDIGMLVSLSQPHFGQYDWKAPDAYQANGYARHAAYYVHVAASHPSVVFYSMSHNATGYNEDIDPEMMDGAKDNRDNWSRNNAKLAVRAEAIVHQLDPDRIVYHHSSGDLGNMYVVNFYTNFVPIQELSDWFGHWAAAGTKPMFTCEYGAPFTWDWTMYRGWYKGQRSFGNARVPWELCVAEWDAQFLGDRAFAISAAEKADLRYEAKQFRAKATWFRWDYPFEVSSQAFDDRFTVIARYITDNWRAFRGWGLSGNSPWEYESYWKLRPGADTGRVALAVDWAGLQRPGFSPDFIDKPFARMDVAYKRDDWLPTPAAEALVRCNMPLLAYIAGPSAHFTSQEHDVAPGQTLEKQLIIINNARETVSCSASWTLHLPHAATGAATISLATGEQSRLPLRFQLPADLPPGAYELDAEVAFTPGAPQHDAFTINVLAPPAARPPAAPQPRIAIFDPRGETTALLGRLGVHGTAVMADSDAAGFDLLIVGKAALTRDGAAPDVMHVHDGLKVVVFEQGPEALEERLGFRIAEYGLRQVFARIPGHPLLAGLGSEHLHDWCGEATILPPRMPYVLSPRFNGAPTVSWCGMEVTRLWRCGCRGNLASVLIEKPACGDFTAVLDGGFSLQYSPLLEYRAGSGMVLFCQLDVTGRSEDDPAALQLVRNIIAYASSWKAGVRRQVVYAGNPAGAHHLESMGLPVSTYRAGALAANQVLVAGTGAGEVLAHDAPALKAWLAGGGHLLGIGLGQAEANTFLPSAVTIANAEHIASFFAPAPAGSALAGIGPADVHNRDPREFPLVTSGAQIVGDGVLATMPEAGVVLCQLEPWAFDYQVQYDRKRTFRRSAVLLARLLGNLGVGADTPLLARIHAPLAAAGEPKRYLSGLYLDVPEEMDDPYRFFGW